ncbi:MAG: iron-sulfur cluster assembly accessory protein [Rhodothermia bacterium]|nr:MAG: iron-sulfur cluster assembly accessory protein [Rhodothermia bacterium]
MKLNITKRAIDKIRKTAEQDGVILSEVMLRVAVIPGGCSGLTYDLGWDSAHQDDDESVELGGIQFVMNLKSRLYVEGSELDFTDGLDGKGFYFDNPNAVRTCACGESFGL